MDDIKGRQGLTTIADEVGHAAIPLPGDDWDPLTLEELLDHPRGIEWATARGAWPPVYIAGGRAHNVEEAPRG